MADEILTKRIKDYTNDTGLQAGDYVVVDSSSEGTRSFDLGSELNSINSTLTDGTIPNADQLISDNYTVDQTPYLYRQTNSNGADRAIEEIVGGSVVWNQRCRILSQSGSANNCTKTVDTTTNTATITPTTYNNNACGLYFPNYITGGHKLYVSAVVKATADLQMAFGDSVASYRVRKDVTANADTRIEAVYEVVGVSGAAVATPTIYARLNDSGWSSGTFTIKDVMLIDLTMMFGSTVADYIYQLDVSDRTTTAGAVSSGIALLHKLFPEEYYEYDARTMRHVSGLSAKETVGKNLLENTGHTGSNNGVTFVFNSDGTVTANGTATGGDAQTSISFTCGVDIPAGAYYFSGSPYGTGANYNVYIWDRTTNSRAKKWDRTTNIGNNIGTSPTEVYFEDGHAYSLTMRVHNGNTANNLVFEPMIFLPQTEDTSYKPYQKHIYALDDSLTLRGIPKLDSNNQLYFDGDTYESDGTVTRKYGVVDLGTLNWTYEPGANSQFNYFQSRPQPFALNNTTNLISTKYAVGNVSYAAGDDCKMMVTASGNYFRIRDLSYTNAATFKSAMSGVMLVYELATPTTETAEPYTNPQICDPYGTEEFVSTSLVPVGHYTKYPENLRAKIEGLPTDFSTLIADTEKTATASKNYSVGDYLIYNNQLYKVTRAIASGATITVGTNVSATTIMAEIKALQ